MSAEPFPPKLTMFESRRAWLAAPIKQAVGNFFWHFPEATTLEIGPLAAIIVTPAGTAIYAPPAPDPDWKNEGDRLVLAAHRLAFVLE